MARGRSPAGHPLVEWVRVPWRMAGEGAPAWDGLARTAATEDVSDGEPKNSTPPASRTSQRVSGCSVIERYSKTPTIPSWSRLREGPAGVLGGRLGCWGGRPESLGLLPPAPQGTGQALACRALVGASSPAFVCRHPEARAKGTCRRDSVCAARGRAQGPRPGERQVRRSRCAAQPWPRTTRRP